MADNIIDGIEYETESSFKESDTHKPVFYAKDVPVQIRRLGDLSFECKKRAKELDDMSPLKRLAEGPEEWNHWVKVYAERWLCRLVKPDRVLWHWRHLFEARPDHQRIDFTDKREHAEEEYYNVDIDNMSDVVFPSHVLFDNACFTSCANFIGAIFLGSASFENTKFAEGVAFDSSEFRSNLSFSEAVFFEMAHFENTKSFKEAEFQKTRFNCEVWFTNAVFAAYTNFVQSRFFESARFHRTMFHNYVDFSNIKFLRSADFQNVEFHRVAAFGLVVFHGNVHFKTVVFKAEAEFRLAIFGKAAIFEEASFEYNCDMNSALFMGDTKWENTIFSCGANFRASQFLAAARFSNVKFDGMADLDYVWFGKSRDTPTPIGYNQLEIETQKIYDVTVVDLESTTIPDFRSTRFETTPNLGFTQVAIPISYYDWWWPLSNNLKVFFGNSGQTRDNGAAAKLRRLQELAAEGHNHTTEKRFFRAELLYRRGHEAKLWPEIAMINAFELVSECGLSFWRPMAWLGLFWLPVFMVFYAIAANFSFSDILTASFWRRDLGYLFSFSAANSLPFLGLFKGIENDAVQHLFHLPKNIPYWLSVWHNLIATIHIFFALLAIRNYFKLG